MPNPQATWLEVSARQAEHLERICRRQTSPQHQVRRARIILKAASGMHNTGIAQALGVDRNTVRLWRKRWTEAAAWLADAEGRGDETAVARRIEEVLSDAYRPGKPVTFSAVPVVQIVALACEEPGLSERPLSRWTPKELAAEAVTRKIVESISPQSVERFFSPYFVAGHRRSSKGGQPQAAPVALLAE